MSDVEAEIAELEASMAEGDSGDYWQNAAAQQRYSDLLAAQETGSAAPAENRSAVRMAELEDMMRQPGNTSEYWHNEQLQREYKALLEAREATASPTGPDLASALGLDDKAAQEVNERIAFAFAGLDTRDLDSAWHGLSEEAQLAFGRVLANPISILASKDTVEDFIQQIGEDVWKEVFQFEQSVTPQERAALRRACLDAKEAPPTLLRRG